MDRAILGHLPGESFKASAGAFWISQRFLSISEVMSNDIKGLVIGVEEMLPRSSREALLAALRQLVKDNGFIE